MIDRRDFLRVAGATAALTGLGGSLVRVAAQQRLTQADLLRFDAERPGDAPAHRRHCTRS